MRLLFPICFLLVLSCSQLTNQKDENKDQKLATSSVPTEYKGFTLEEIRTAYRLSKEQNWNADYVAWLSGGMPTRYYLLNLTELWPSSIIQANGKTKDLYSKRREEVGSFHFSLADSSYVLSEYVTTAPVNGMLIIHQGKIVFEEYPRMFPLDKHAWASISKTQVGLLVGILAEQGLIDTSLPIENYLPLIRGTDVGAVPIIDYLDYSCGIDCVDFGNFENCAFKFWDALGWPIKENAMEDPLRFTLDLKSHRPSGQVWEYGDINPLMLTILIEEVSGMKYSDFLEKEIWMKAGMESDGTILNAAFGRSVSPVGFSSRLRDLARYGMLFVPSGRKNDTPIVSDRLLKAIQTGRPSIFSHKESKYWWRDDWEGANVFEGDTISHSTYMWEMVMKDGDFFKAGAGGSGLYVSPKRDLVIAYFGSPDEEGNWNELYRISRRLAKSEIFNKTNYNKH